MHYNDIEDQQRIFIKKKCRNLIANKTQEYAETAISAWEPCLELLIHLVKKAIRGWKPNTGSCNGNSALSEVKEKLCCDETFRLFEGGRKNQVFWGIDLTEFFSAIQIIIFRGQRYTHNPEKAIGQDFSN